MTGLQLWMLAGVLVFGGAACLLWYLAPAEPDLADVATRLSPAGTPRRSVVVGAGAGGELELTDRVGLWALRRLPSARLRVPTHDLAILAKPVHVFYGEKVLAVAIAVLAGPLLSFLLSLSVPFPLYVPVIVTVGAAVVAWRWPNVVVRDNAATARAEFNAALSAYIDLVALERRAGGSGVRQALENAALVADSWPFRRVGDALTRSRFAGIGPWQALEDLAKDLELRSLSDLAGVMRLAGEESAQVYDTLRTRSTMLRSELLTTELGKANATGERIAFPITVMTVVFAALLITPALVRLLTG